MRKVPNGSGKPVAIIAHTVKGKGVSFMEDDNNWHYRIPNAEGSCRRKAAARSGMRNNFADEITKLAAADKRVVLLSGDIGNRLFDDFKAAAPDRFFNCGVAEANMMGMAAGLAMSGLRPVVYTIAPFTTTRCLEQIRVDVCYHNVPVVIVGVGAGLALCVLGRHAPLLRGHRVAPVAARHERVWPRPTRSKCAAPCARRCGMTGPSYIRMGKKGEPNIHRDVPPVRDRPQPDRARRRRCLPARGRRRCCRMRSPPPNCSPSAAYPRMSSASITRQAAGRGAAEGVLRALPAGRRRSRSTA